MKRRHVTFDEEQKRFMEAQFVAIADESWAKGYTLASQRYGSAMFLLARASGYLQSFRALNQDDPDWQPWCEMIASFEDEYQAWQESLKKR
jgi:hypothetical protein